MSNALTAIILTVGGLVALVVIEAAEWVAQRAVTRLLEDRDPDLEVPAWVNQPPVFDAGRETAARLDAAAARMNRRAPSLTVVQERQARSDLYRRGDVIPLPTTVERSTPAGSDGRGA